MIAWTKGGTATFVAVSGENVTLRSTIPAPPGARLDATFVAEPKAPLRIKVHGSKKEDDGTFTMRGRLVDVTRELRARVEALAAPARSC